MGKLTDDVRAYLMRSEAALADEALTLRRFGLLEPLLALLEGRTALVACDSAPKTLLMPTVTEMWGFEEPMPFTIVPHRWSDMQELPPVEDDYAVPFVAMLLQDLMTVDGGPTGEELQQVFRFYESEALSGIASLMRSKDGAIAAHFERSTWEMMARSYMLIATLMTIAIAHGNLEAIKRLAPTARLMAQVLPVGLTVHGLDMQLHVLCND